jgi:3-isopropylmalate/(R)-2-methylmalate dehydratase large subunit
MPQTLFRKVWDAHTVRTLPTGQSQLLIGLHLVHEVTSPQAFAMLRAKGWKVPYPARTFATADHVVPTVAGQRPFGDEAAEEMVAALERNCSDFGITLEGPGSRNQGIVHVIAPELGLIQPGMTVACGDSHTSTHGAFGAVAFGIGTSQVRDVLASQCLALEPLKVRRIAVSGRRGAGVYAKDIALAIIRHLGVKGGVGYAHEYGGDMIDRMTMEERMTICNMSVEGGARAGYVNPDETTYRYLAGRPFAPAGPSAARARDWWESIASDAGAPYDDEVDIDASGLEPMVTWGINPGQAIGVSERIPTPSRVAVAHRAPIEEAIEYMGFEAGAPIAGTRIDVAFIGSCTNGRIEDLREAARVASGRRVAAHVKALVVPGSAAVAREAEREELDQVFLDAGFEWRRPGCSLCLAMNPDRLEGRQVCAASANRNFKGRQGSPEGRTLLMSPAMVAAAAVAGEVIDVRPMLGGTGA